MNKILIVEDDRGIVMSLEIRLGAAGYEVHKAFDTTEAVKTALAVEPDLLLLDIAVPGGGGFQVVETLKRHETARDTPFIFFTANQKPGLREKAGSLGAVDFLQKPYDASVLLAVIEKALAPPVHS